MAQSPSADMECRILNKEPQDIEVRPAVIWIIYIPCSIFCGSQSVRFFIGWDAEPMDGKGRNRPYILQFSYRAKER